MANPNWKYMEEDILREIGEYVASTYGAHYVGSDNIQAIDLIASKGHLNGFAIGNIIKYGSRYGSKGGFNSDDLMKVIHYAMFALWELKKKQMKSNPLDDTIENQTHTSEK